MQDNQQEWEAIDQTVMEDPGLELHNQKSSNVLKELQQRSEERNSNIGLFPTISKSPTNRSPSDA